MDIAEIRKQYPQYADMPDAAIAKGFHEKFYSDMPYEQFASKIGLQPDAAPPKPTPTRFDSFLDKWTGAMKGIGKDVISGNMPGASAASDLISKVSTEGGGQVAGFGGRIGLPPEIAAGAGVAANMGLNAIPALFGAKAAATQAAPTLQNWSTKLMTESLKPVLKSVQTGEAAKGIQTMLDKGFNVTEGSREKLNSQIETLDAALSNEIANSTAGITLQKSWDAIKQKLQKFGNQALPESDTKTIRQAWSEFKNHPLIQEAFMSGNTVPVQTAQTIKQATYNVLNGKYGEQGSALIEAQKAIARGLRESIAGEEPKASAINAELSDLLAAKKLLDRRLAMASKNDIVSFAPLAHSINTAILFIVGRSPASKSMIGNALYKGSERIPETLVGTGIAVGEDIKQQMSLRDLANASRQEARP